MQEKLKLKIDSNSFLSLVLMGIGAIAVLFSLFNESSILSLVGLGLFFWGTVLVYIKTKEYIRKSILDASLSPLIPTLSVLIKELEFHGKQVYLPPKYFTDPEEIKLFIPKHKDEDFPTPDEFREQQRPHSVANRKGLLITPPGVEIMRLSEKTLKRSLTEIDLSQIKNILPKLFTEELEIVEKIEVENEKTENVYVTIEGSIYGSEWTSVGQLSGSIHSPNYLLVSAISCLLARVSGSIVFLENVETFEDGRKARLKFQLVETGEL